MFPDNTDHHVPISGGVLFRATKGASWSYADGYGLYFKSLQHDDYARTLRLDKHSIAGGYLNSLATVTTAFSARRDQWSAQDYLVAARLLR